MSESSVRVVFLGDSASAVRSVRTLESGFSSLGRAAHLAATAVGAAVVGSLGLAVKSAIEFDRAMRNVQSITKSSEKDFQALSRSVLALARTTGQGPKTLAEGLYDVVSSGFKAKDAITVLGASAKAATAGMTDTATSVKAVVAILNAYHLSASKARQVSDVLFQEVNLGVNTFAELAQNIGDTAPQAAALKVPFEQVAAALATITLHGTSMAEASTQVARVLTAMVKPTTALRAEFKKLGYENGQAAIGALGFVGVIKKLSHEAGGNQETIAKWLGDIRGIRGVINLSGENLASYTDIVRKMGAATEGVGATQKAFAEQAMSISFQWQVAKASLTAAAIPIGQLLFPALIKAAQGVSYLADAINRHMPQIRAVTHSAITAMASGWQSIQPTLHRVAGFIQTQVAPAFRRAFGSIADVSRSLVGVIRQNWPQISSIVQSGGRTIQSIARLIATALSAIAPVVRALRPVFHAAFVVLALEARVGAAGIRAACAVIAAAIRAMAAIARALIAAVVGAWRGLRAAAGIVVRFLADSGALKAAMGVIHALASAWNALRSAASHVINFVTSSSGSGPPRGPRGWGPAPHRAAGGFIPGSPGAPVPILAHAGEVVLNRAQQAMLGGPQAIAQMFGFTGDEGPQFAAGGFVGRGLSAHKPRKPKIHKAKLRNPRASARASGKLGKKLMAGFDQDELSAGDIVRTYDEMSRVFSISIDHYGPADAGDDIDLNPDEIEQLISERQRLVAVYIDEMHKLADAMAAFKKAIKTLVAAIKKEREAIAADIRQIAKLNKEKSSKSRTAKLKAVNTDLSSRKKNLAGMTTDLSDLQQGLATADQNYHHVTPFNLTDALIDVQELRAQQVDTRARIKAAQAGSGSGGGDTGAVSDTGAGAAAGPADQSAMIAQLLEELGRLKLGLALQGVQVPIIGSFAKGTLTVPETGLAMVHAGETITPANRAGGGDGGSIADVHVAVHVDPAMAWLTKFIRVETVRASGEVAKVHGESANRRRRGGLY